MSHKPKVTNIQKLDMDNLPGAEPTPLPNQNLTPSEIKSRQDKINSLPTIEQINQNPSLLSQLFEYQQGIIDPVTNDIYKINGYTENQLKEAEAQYHINNLSVVPTSLTTPDFDGNLIFEFENWLPSDICDELMVRATPKLISSDKIFASKNCMVTKIKNSITRMIQNNINNMTNLPLSYYEEIIVRDYSVDGTSTFPQRGDPSHRQNTYWDRVLSVYIFLNDNYKGGELVFTDINRTITPQKGKLILYWTSKWSSTGLNVIKTTSTIDKPVLSGEKWTATFPIHSRESWIPSYTRIQTSEDDF